MCDKNIDRHGVELSNDLAILSQMVTAERAGKEELILTIQSYRKVIGDVRQRVSRLKRQRLHANTETLMREIQQLERVLNSI